MKKGIVSYDLTVNKYRTQLSKILILYGERIQLSVFEFELNNKEYKEMVKDVREFYKEYLSYCLKRNIRGNRESIRIFLCCESCVKKSIVIGDKNSNKDNLIII